MEKIILVDGNNLLFRSYYATAYNGNYMRNSKGFPTNALFGFTNMMNKIINEEKPNYIIVAFDKGKTFRHEKCASYKGGRMETPDELKNQFPVAKELLTAMGIKYYECDNYEADDIIGTFAKFCEDDPNFVGTIISSDKDLLQLIGHDVDIKLLKQKDYIRYNEDSFKEAYGIEPKRVVDLKALMGDASDNIKGVKGIGEKTALKLLTEYGNLDNIYANIDSIKGSIHDKLLNDKESAYESYFLATIVRDVPMDISICDIKYKAKDVTALNHLYEELEFYSFLKHEQDTEKKSENDITYTILREGDELKIDSDVALYLEVLGGNYHTASVIGMFIYNEDLSIYITSDLIPLYLPKIIPHIAVTYDLKKLIVSLSHIGIKFEKLCFDTMLAAYLLDYNVKDDIAYLSSSLGYDIEFYENMYGKNFEKTRSIDEIAKNMALKAHFLFETYSMFKDKLNEENLYNLFSEIEIPLAKTLAHMELNGVSINVDALDKMGVELQDKIEVIEKEIYDYAGCEFNISSPKQLGDILFEKLNLPHGKKNRSGYSTSADILEKIKDKHPIVDKILEYRMLTKLYTTYIEGLKNYILDDGKIHTIYTQALTRTGRLSSIEPNLQNIPIRYEYGRLIRKAFVPSPNSVMIDADYSQIELRILAHMANIKSLIDAFHDEIDIHTKTASDVFKVSTDSVTHEMRRIAKAVNFGIIYGISNYGLAENLGISNSDAKKFIESYFEAYPGIFEYMEGVKKKAYEDGFVTTLMQRKRYIPELKNKNKLIRSSGERIALNTPIQGTSADIIKKAMILIDDRLESEHLKSKMILQVHDELVFDTLESEKDRVFEIVKEVMEHVCELRVPLKIEISMGYNWYEAK